MNTRPHFVVVFDTNAYLGLSPSGLDRTIAFELRAGAVAMASVWPCLELLSKCAGPDSGLARRARSTLAKVWKHTGYATPGGARIRMQEAGELTLVRGLFGKTPDEPLLEVGFVGNLVVKAFELEPQAFLEEHHSELMDARVRVELEERAFVAPPQAQPVSRATIEGPTAIPILAAGLLQTLAEKYEVDLEGMDVSELVKHLVRSFPVALYFMRDVLADLGNSAVMPGGVNSVWDQKIAFHAGPGASVLGLPTLLVTDDRRLLRAAAGANERTRVLTLPEYQELLESPKVVANRLFNLRGKA